MRCKSVVYDDEDYNFYTNSYEKDTKLATYLSEENLKKKIF